MTCFLWSLVIASPSVASDLVLKTPTRAENLKGVILMLCAMFIFAAVDAQAKYLTQSLPPLQIVWSRQLGLFFGVIILIGLRGFDILKTDQPVLQMARGICAALSATLFIIGISFVPLSDAVAVTFIAPLVVTIMGAVLLKEFVGIHRWTAIVIGFIGTLIIIRPGFESFHPALLLPLLAAILFAFRQVISRYLARADKTETTVAYTALSATLLLSLALPFIWQTPQHTHELMLLIGMASMAAIAELLVIKALEIALAVVVAPVQYTIIIWSSFYGFVVFDQWPDSYTLLGTLIIILSGLYTLHRERLRPPVS